MQHISTHYMTYFPCFVVSIYHRLLIERAKFSRSDINEQEVNLEE